MVQPVVKRTDWWEACLTCVEQRQPPGWTEIGVAMCHVAPPEQRELFAAMEGFRADVVAGRRDPTEFLAFHNGPEQRSTLIVGIIATSPKKEERQRQVNLAARTALEATGGKPAIVMSWAPIATQMPYLGIGLARTPP